MVLKTIFALFMVYLISMFVINRMFEKLFKMMFFALTLILLASIGYFWLKGF